MCLSWPRLHAWSWGRCADTEQTWTLSALIASPLLWEREGASTCLLSRTEIQLLKQGLGYLLGSPKSQLLPFSSRTPFPGCIIALNIQGFCFDCLGKVFLLACASQQGLVLAFPEPQLIHLNNGIDDSCCCFDKGADASD